MDPVRGREIVEGENCLPIRGEFGDGLRPLGEVVDEGFKRALGVGAVLGTILVSGLTNRSYAASMIVLAIIGIVGLGAASSCPPNGLSTRSTSNCRHVLCDRSAALPRHG